MKKTIWGVLLALWIIGGFSPDLVFSQSLKTYSVGVEDYKQFLPYSEFRDGKYSGLSRDVLELFARDQGIVLSFEVYPLKRRDQLFVNGKLDLIFPDNPNWYTKKKKGKTVHYVPVLEFIDGVIVLPENHGRLPGSLKVLGVPLGFTPWQYMTEVSSGNLKLIFNANYEGLYHQVINKRVDGAYVNIKIANYYWSHYHPAEKKPWVFDQTLPHVSGYWYLSSMKYPEIISAFREFMDKRAPEIEALKVLYGFYRN